MVHNSELKVKGRLQLPPEHIGVLQYAELSEQISATGQNMNVWVWYLSDWFAAMSYLTKLKNLPDNFLLIAALTAW